ncbi:hypothetical protein EVAR_19752_1 [Eumeta japonica]|uniref:Uncharacterized protein n=1 Tax=Eumeta variegata TaxID=151549 RepID=A0A4C1UQJ9_EUMVA|nr:hypothetical protein EVAR_19752_1 [Eumeta japonica]
MSIDQFHGYITTSSSPSEIALSTRLSRRSSAAALTSRTNYRGSVRLGWGDCWRESGVLEEEVGYRNSGRVPVAHETKFNSGSCYCKSVIGESVVYRCCELRIWIFITQCVMMMMRHDDQDGGTIFRRANTKTYINNARPRHVCTNIATSTPAARAPHAGRRRSNGICCAPAVTFRGRVAAS